MLKQASNKNLDFLNENRKSPVSLLRKYVLIFTEGFPFSPHFIINCLHLLIIASLNFSTVVPNKYLDVLTPWLVVMATKSSPAKTVALILICGMLQEINSAAPAGVYLTAYLFFYLTFLLSHEHLSWSNLHIKILSILFCLLSVVGFQYTSYMLLGGSIVFSFEKIAELIIFLFCTTLVGLVYFHTAQLNRELH